MKRPNVFIRIGLGMALVTAPITALALTAPILANSASANPPAAFSTTNVNWLGGSPDTSGNPGYGYCLAPNSPGSDPVNCNQYNVKEDVWLNGGPAAAIGGDGAYFFTVLDPGGQGNPNDFTAGNLSSSQGDYTTREFTVSGGTVTNIGNHAFDSGLNRLDVAPFDDTTNNGGVYILAVCYLGPNPGSVTYPVTPKRCKYDAFKVVGQNNTFPPFSDPTIFKSANLDYTSTDNWTITKTAAAPTTVDSTSSTATFSYTVTVTMTGPTVSAVTISGNIDVFNANLEPDGITTAPMDLSTLTDTLTGDVNGATCVIAGGSPDLTLSVADTTYPYTCDLGTYLPTGTVTNTATMTWAAGQDLGNGVTSTAGSDFKTVPVTVDAPTLKDQSVTVSDPNAPPSAGSPWTFSGSGTVTYSIAWPVVANACMSYVNTATMLTADSGVSTPASATVTVCGRAAGGLTIGFWQNKNGQAIINAGQSNGSVCKVTTYLRTFLPFQDLPSTATCSAVAKYVTNVVKAANASGASMNAMLKAQMLATALNVYFSGNEGDPLHITSLGGVKIDLTNISGSNDSAAFSGSCETVSQMLSDASAAATAATAINPLAAPWYTQSKSVQGKAEMSFDAVNNGAAFSC